MPKVLVTDPIAVEGVGLLQTETDVDIRYGMKPAELLAAIGQYDALVVRSETKVTAAVIKAAKRLKVVARAGIGVDNIDVNAATEAGIAVVNAPLGNTVAAAEHTLALMLALARNIPQAYNSLRGGQWKRSAFLGVEVRDKTLGIIGLGRVGDEVARRAQSFGMRLLAHDPFVSADYARRLGAELTTLDNLLAESDFVTLHAPPTEGARQLLGARQFSLMKPGARLINVAQGELVDEAALLAALDSGHLAGAALDVFAQEPAVSNPLVQHPNVIATPHLGASTAEAQREVATEAAAQVLAALRGEPARNTVNAPFIPPEVHATLAPYVKVATLLGRLLNNLSEGQFSELTISYEGDIANHDTHILKAALLAGLLANATTETVNPINAPTLALRRGLSVTEQRRGVAPEYSSLITATLATSQGSLSLAGASLRDEAHLVRINNYWLDIVPNAPYLLFIDNPDRPGSIGAVGAVCGKHNINISFMEVGRLSPRGRAMMVIGLDDAMPPGALAEIRALPQINSARLVKL